MKKEIKVLAPFSSLWPEVMLTAAIHFIYTERGIGSIYYHTRETWRRVNQIFGDAQPRSLYSDLPRKFCFQMTDEDSRFSKHDRGFICKKRSQKQVAWYKLAL